MIPTIDLFKGKYYQLIATIILSKKEETAVNEDTIELYHDLKSKLFTNEYGFLTVYHLLHLLSYSLK
jgi:hypothetical protein